MSTQVVTKTIAQKRAIKNADLPAAPDSYQARVLKLIPAEVVAVYMAVLPLLKNQSATVQWLVFALLLIGNILYKRNAGVKDWKQFLITSIAFILWVLSFGGPVDGLYPSAIPLSHILMPIYIFLVPLIYH